MARMIPCRACGGPARPAFEATVLARHRVRYFHCPACGYLETEEPTWLGEAYASAINLQDTGLVDRNLRFADETVLLLFHFFDRRGKFVDFAGGTGLFTRLMRDAGFDFRWHDAHAENVHARGFEAAPDERGVELVTSFESFEHFVRPEEELRRMLAMSRNVLLSTELLPSPPPAPGSWPYYGLEHGQHVGFFERRTLERLAAEHGLRLHAWGPLHLMTDRALSPLKVRLVRKLRRRLVRRARRAMGSLIDADHDRLARLPGSSPAR
jgi:ribosomal protein S27AE